MDYYVYLKQANAFSSRSFVQYCSALGFRIDLHPSFDLLEDAGFSPIHLVDERFAGAGGSCDFLSGFELFSSEYYYVSQPQQKAPGFLKKLRKAKPVQETPFDSAIKDATWQITLGCSGADSFEVLLAYIFGAYLVKCCGGVFDDPQTGQFYDDSGHLEGEIQAITSELLEQAEGGELLVHRFNGWT